MIRDTSSQSYYNLQNLGDRQRAVYKVIRSKGQACNIEIAEELSLPINSVTPRTKELVDRGLVEEGARKIGPTGRLTIYWQLKKKESSVDWDALRVQTIQQQKATDLITNSDQPSLL